VYVAENATGTTLTDLYLTDAAAFGVWVNGADQVTIADSRIEGTQAPRVRTAVTDQPLGDERHRGPKHRDNRRARRNLLLVGLERRGDGEHDVGPAVRRPLHVLRRQPPRGQRRLRERRGVRADGQRVDRVGQQHRGREPRRAGTASCSRRSTAPSSATTPSSPTTTACFCTQRAGQRGARGTSCTRTAWVHHPRGHGGTVVAGNGFVTNDEQVLTTTRELVAWNGTDRGNYWSDARVADTDGDGLSDARHRPAGAAERLVKNTRPPPCSPTVRRSTRSGWSRAGSRPWRAPGSSTTARSRAPPTTSSRIARTRRRSTRPPSTTTPGDDHHQ